MPDILQELEKVERGMLELLEGCHQIYETYVQTGILTDEQLADLNKVSALYLKMKDDV